MMMLATTTFVKTQNYKTMTGRIVCGEQRISEFKEAKSILPTGKVARFYFKEIGHCHNNSFFP